MDVFLGNRLLEDRVMNALEWAKYLRHQLDGEIAPFLFEWSGEDLKMRMLQAGGDPEDFAYSIAKDSNVGSNQFVLGYEGALMSQDGHKHPALIIKGYDRTMEKGVFIAQPFEGKETAGEFILKGTPVFMGNPPLPFSVDSSLEPNYEGTYSGYSNMSLKNGGRAVIMSNPLPAVAATNIKHYIRSMVSGESADSLNGQFDFSLAPTLTGSIEFSKYCILEAIKQELEGSYVKQWEANTGSKVKVNVKYGEDFWRKDFERDNASASNEPAPSSPPPPAPPKEEHKPDPKEEHKALVNKFMQLDRRGLDAEYRRIISVPNARTNINSLREMTALMEVYKAKGIAMPGEGGGQNQGKSGCLGVILILIVLTALACM